MKLSLPRSRGAHSLLRVGATQSEIAARVGVKQSLVSMWISADRIPSAVKRDALWKAYRIEPVSWDELQNTKPKSTPPKSTPPPPPPSGVVAEAGPMTVETVREKVIRFSRMADEAVEETRLGTPLERLRGIKVSVEISKMVAMMLGELQDISEAKIVRHHAWRRLEARILEALKPHPDALRSVADAIREIETSVVEIRDAG